MTDQEFTDALAVGRETSGVEFKGPGVLSDGRLVAQVVRAALAMANRAQGGAVIVGIVDEGDAIQPVGLSTVELSTWTFDGLADQLARYADPNVIFNLETKVYNGNSFIILDIEEFSEIPVLCKRAYGNVLRDGACYVRTRRKPESSELPTQTEMRELLDLAINKGVSLYLDRARRVGLYVPPATVLPDDLASYFEQRGGQV